MSVEQIPPIYLRLYKTILHLYPAAYRAQFNDSMTQTFVDLCRDCVRGGRSLPAFAGWMLLDATAGAIKEHIWRRTAPTYATALAAAYILIALSLGLDGDLVPPLYLAAMAIIVLLAGIASLETRGRSRKYRAAVTTALGTAFIVAWANPAVGMIGSEDNQANLIFLGVFGVGALGALRSSREPRDLAMAMFATAIAQAAVGVLAFVVELPLPPFHNVAIGMLWALSGLLFLLSERDCQSRPPV